MRIDKSIIVIIILGVLLFLSISRCSSNSRKAELLESNVEYLQDTVRTYKDKSGRLASERTLLTASAKGLKELNSTLYEELKAEKGKVKFISTTKMQYKTDTLYKSDKVSFEVVSDSVLSDFSLNLDTLILGIRDNKVFAKTTDSNVIIQDLDATEINKRIRRIGFGVFAGPMVGYNPIDRDLDAVIGVGVGVTFKIK